MDPQVLILTVGLPRSGKTTWARERGAPIVNPDSIRLALHGQAYIQSAEKVVWMVAELMVKALFLAGHPTVIVDATNASKKRRDAWKGDWETQFVVFEANKETCSLRAIEADREDLLPVIERMAETWERLDEDEQKNHIN